MQYNVEMGGFIFDKVGKLVLNFEVNIKSLIVYCDLFKKVVFFGVVDYDWGGCEESFCQGIVVMMQIWLVGVFGYYDFKIFKVVGKVDIVFVLCGKGLLKIYGIGGWGMVINVDVKDKQKEVVWIFIKWVMSFVIQKEMNFVGVGSYICKSMVVDKDLNVKYFFLLVFNEVFENGDGDYCLCILEYLEIQDILGMVVNFVLVGIVEFKVVLDVVQVVVVKLF